MFLHKFPRSSYYFLKCCNCNKPIVYYSLTVCLLLFPPSRGRLAAVIVNRSSTQRHLAHIARKYVSWVTTESIGIRAWQWAIGCGVPPSPTRLNWKKCNVSGQRCRERSIGGHPHQLFLRESRHGPARGDVGRALGSLSRSIRRAGAHGQAVLLGRQSHGRSSQYEEDLRDVRFMRRFK
jgi:hypothetical protein